MDVVSALQERGFVVIPGPEPPAGMATWTEAFDDAVETAALEDIRIGSTSTRVTDFVNRGAAFDGIYIFPPLLEACRLVIGGPFKLSSFHARTVRPGASGPDFHVDVKRGSADWPLLGFIMMIDEFRPDNGATCFVPGSHLWTKSPEDPPADPRVEPPAHVLACGTPGSLLIFNGSAWHDHGANTSSAPRRSIQGAFIPRTGRAGTDFSGRMQPETRARLSPITRHVLALDEKGGLA